MAVPKKSRFVGRLPFDKTVTYLLDLTVIYLLDITATYLSDITAKYLSDITNTFCGQSLRNTGRRISIRDSSTDTTVGWTKNTRKPDFFEKRKKSSKTQKLKDV